MARLALFILLFAFAGVATQGPALANMPPPAQQEFKLGIKLDIGDEGPTIKALTPGLAGEQAGLKVGDIILGINGRYAKVMAKGALQAFAQESHEWPVDLLIARDDRIITVHIGDGLRTQLF